jgi:plastocyanin
MRLAPAALTILLFAIAPASATAIRHAAPVYVVIVKGKPVPTPRRVAVHHSVTWFNNDKGAHRITSDHGRWSSFVLRYRKQHAVRFDRRGRYPYKVDGKAKGVIIVGAGGGGSSGGQTTTLFHYDVHVSGHAKSIRTYSGETRADWNGTETFTVDWTSATSLWFPLKELSAEAPFTLETGTQSNSLSCGSTCNPQEFLKLRRYQAPPLSGPSAV